MDADDRQIEKHLSRELAKSLVVMHQELRRAGMGRILSFWITLNHYKTLVTPDNPMNEVAERMIAMMERHERDDDE